MKSDTVGPAALFFSPSECRLLRASAAPLALENPFVRVPNITCWDSDWGCFESKDEVRQENRHLDNIKFP